MTAPTPFSQKHLRYFLAIPERTVELQEVDGGFQLVITAKGSKHLLFAQRNHPRLFRSLDRAAAMLRDNEALEFTIKMRADDLF